MKGVELATGRLTYWDEGEGRPLLFIHGIGTSGAVWKDDLAPLAPTHRVVVYDRRGYGESAPSPGTWSGQVSDVSGLVEALALEKPIIVGYSGGASIALAAVLEKPDLAGALVLLDPACNLKKCMTPDFIKAQIVVRLLRRFRGERAGILAWMRYVTRYPTGGCAFDKSPEARRERILANAHGLFCDVQTPDGFQVDEARMAGIAVPMTIIDAKLSPPFLRKSCERLRRALPQARTATIERAGHHITIDARDELLDLLRATP